MANEDLSFTLDEAVAEVLGLLTGLNVKYEPEQDRYYTIVRALNRALRAIAMEAEWSYYYSQEEIGTAVLKERNYDMRSSVRPRILIDDSVKLYWPGEEYPVKWAYFLPREAIDKTPDDAKLWVASSRSTLQFSRYFTSAEVGLRIMVPVMREPKMFRLPPRPENNDPITPVPTETRSMLVDFPYPDLVVMKAAYMYAQTQPSWQPRVQTLEAQYKDMMYSLTERDTRNTDAPQLLPWSVPVESDIFGGQTRSHIPHQQEDWWS